jgi:hypothetical protein
MMQLRVSLAVVLVAALVPTATRAQCVIMPLDYYLSANDIAAIFRGTASDVKTVPAGQIVTFEVDRVWKGRVSSAISTSAGAKRTRLSLADAISSWRIVRVLNNAPALARMSPPHWGHTFAEATTLTVNL